jgi:hypothetical protein
MAQKLIGSLAASPAIFKIQYSFFVSAADSGPQ